jgi:hypothetical protein
MSILTTGRLLGLAALALLVAAPAVHAQDTFLPKNTTLNKHNPVLAPFSAIVGFANFDDYINGVNPTSPTIRIVDGANVNALEVHNSSIIDMRGGSVGSNDFLGELLSEDTSTINISGGTVVFDLDVQGASTVNFSGGTVGADIVTHDNTTVNMLGGIVDHDLLINGSSTFNLGGGSILTDVFVQDSSVLTVYGTGLSMVLVDPNFEGFYSEYKISGRLLDHTILAGRIIFVQNGSGARFFLHNIKDDDRDHHGKH